MAVVGFLPSGLGPTSKSGENFQEKSGRAEVSQEDKASCG